MTKIIINIDMEDLTSGINQMVDEDAMEDEMGEDEDFSCPLSTQDEELNAENRQSAIDEFSYGPAVGSWEKKKASCGVCEYYNIRAEMMSCVLDGLEIDEHAEVGYCTKLDFTCAADNMCNAYEKGGPMTDYEDMDENKPLEGNSRDIF